MVEGSSCSPHAALMKSHSTVKGALYISSIEDIAWSSFGAMHIPNIPQDNSSIQPNPVSLAWKVVFMYR